MLALTFAKS